MDSFLCGMAPITIHKISHAEGREMVRLHGADKVLFASDYPAKHATQAIEDVLKMELTEEENRLIFYKNAEKLLGITCGNE